MGESAVLIGLLCAASLLCRGLVLDVKYKNVPVLHVIQVPGGDMNERLVIVDLGHRTYPIKTSDRLLIVTPGSLACVAKKYVLMRRWQRYSLALPGYCRQIPVYDFHLKDGAEKSAPRASKNENALPAD